MNQQNLNEQQKIVLTELEHGRRLTQQDAWYLGVGRLSGRILELKQRGYRIDSRFIKVFKKNGKAANVKEYWLAAEPKPELLFADANIPLGQKQETSHV